MFVTLGILQIFINAKSTTTGKWSEFHFPHILHNHDKRKQKQKKPRKKKSPSANNNAKPVVMKRRKNNGKNTSRRKTQRVKTRRNNTITQKRFLYTCDYIKIKELAGGFSGFTWFSLRGWFLRFTGFSGSSFWFTAVQTKITSLCSCYKYTIQCNS